MVLVGLVVSAQIQTRWRIAHDQVQQDIFNFRLGSRIYRPDLWLLGLQERFPAGQQRAESTGGSAPNGSVAGPRSGRESSAQPGSRQFLRTSGLKSPQLCSLR